MQTPPLDTWVTLGKFSEPASSFVKGMMHLSLRLNKINQLHGKGGAQTG